ncbi:MAG: class I SAM-dependent methyltransferase [Pigmentiphaga sp.]|nr:class I SAM-dependent methyltransferase [Pigmentiphaga sp.]
MNQHVDGDSPSAEYLTDVAYPAHFHRETMPSWIGGALAALGRRAPDLAAPFTWLELGCGAGLGALVAAACHPQGRFIGIDLSEREVERAAGMARAARLDNVRFVCQDIRDVAKGPEPAAIPHCDFIVSHGVYSWVAEPVREAMADLVRTRLRPGGVAYLGYTSQPGAVSFSAAQKLMRLAAPLQPGDSVAKVGAGVALLRRLAQSGAGYFTAHPAVLEHLEQMDRMDAAYLAHEYLNAHWQAFHVSDIMDQMAGAGCDFAGSASLLENIDAVSLPSGAQAELAQLQRQGVGIALLETARDIARNQSLRRDLYQKQNAAPAHHYRLEADQHRAVLLAQRVMRMPGAPAASELPDELKIDTGIGPVTVAAQAVRPLLQALSQAPRSYAELAALPAFAGNSGLINPLLQILAWIGWLHVVPAAAPTEAAARGAALARLEAVLNEAGLPLQVVGTAGTALWPAVGGSGGGA